MFEKYFSAINSFVAAHKPLVAFFIIVLVVLSALNIPFIRYDNNIEFILPQSKDVFSSISFLREAEFTDKVILNLGLNDKDYGTPDLINTVELLYARLHSPFIKKINKGTPGVNSKEQVMEFLKFAPQIIDPSSLSGFDKILNPSAIKSILRSNYYKLLSPAGSIAASFIQADPLGLHAGILRNLNNISQLAGYNIVADDGYLLSADKRNAILIIDTEIKITDGFGARKLVDFLQNQIKTLPKFVNVGIISAHMHSVSNEDTIKKDIKRTVTIAMLAFLTVFLLTFKDLRAFIFLLIPFFAVLIALNISASIFGKLSYFIIGLGAVIIGIADDYGIHVYVAVHTNGKRSIVKDIAKPLVVAALTTISVFISFFFSSIKGYHQLAVFSIISILICIFFVLFIFPHFLKEKEPVKNIPIPAMAKAFSDKMCISIWIIILIVLTTFALRVTFDSDISKLDGSSRSVFLEEEKFRSIYSRKEEPAMLVVMGKSKEEAMEKTEDLCLKAKSLIGEDNLASITSVWPSLKSRERNADFWISFWKNGREVELKSLLRKFSKDYNFTKDSFRQFFLNLYSNTDINDNPYNLELFKNISSQFIRKTGSGYKVISFFPDQNKFIQSLSGLIQGKPGVFIVSRKFISKAISNAIIREAAMLSFVAGILVLMLSWILLKNIKLTILALLPVFSAVVSVLGTFSIIGLPINAATLIALMMVIGLCIDYGVFMLYNLKNNFNTGTLKAMMISASTTLIGGAALLFARHPVLYSIGLTLVAGLSAGYIISQSLLPSLYRVFILKGVKFED